MVYHSVSIRKKNFPAQTEKITKINHRVETHAKQIKTSLSADTQQ